MCLILFAHRVVPAHRLVVAANRDEFHARPAAPAAFWADAPGVLAGRDLQEGGTWLGISRSGRFAAVTNFGEVPADPPPPRSRGALVSGFLRGDDRAIDAATAIAREADQYRGFNLLLGDGDDLVWYSNRGGPPQRLQPGIYGLSNHLLDTDWPKVRRGKAALRQAICQRGADAGALLGVLTDEWNPPDHELPERGRPLEQERLSARCFIRSDVYGTRASTLVWIGAHEARLVEHGWGPDGRPGARVEHAARLDA